MVSSDELEREKGSCFYRLESYTKLSLHSLVLFLLDNSDTGDIWLAPPGKGKFQQDLLVLSLREPKSEVLIASPVSSSFYPLQLVCLSMMDQI